MTLFGALEAGGTKVICAVGTAHDKILARETIKTTEPMATLAQCLAFFHRCERDFGKIAKLGIAGFGPLDLSAQSPSFGSLLNTPKKGWAGTNFIEPFQKSLGVPVVLDTDVNAAVLAEIRWGSVQGACSAAYVTIGTGIGVGIYANGALLHGAIHPELGHIAVPRATSDNEFTSVCPFHGDCFEGFASGPAMKARWGQGAEELAAGHPGWDIQAYYIAQLCRAITLSVSPSHIVLGGGVMAHQPLLKAVRAEFGKLLNNYLPISERSGGLGNYIVRESFGGASGLVGAFALVS